MFEGGKTILTKNDVSFNFDGQSVDVLAKKAVFHYVYLLSCRKPNRGTVHCRVNIHKWSETLRLWWAPLIGL